MNHFAPTHILNNFEALIEKFYMNGLDSNYMTINLRRNKEMKCSDGDFKKSAEVEQ